MALCAPRGQCVCPSVEPPGAWRRRLPKIFNLRLDPYERADITSNTYYDWTLQRAFLVVPAQALVAQFVDTFKEFPPRQRPSSFSVEQVLEQMSRSHGG